MQKDKLGLCYITFKNIISFKEHLEIGAHLLAPRPAGVKGGFMREFMFCWMGSVWGEKAQNIQRVHPCNVCDKT